MLWLIYSILCTLYRDYHWDMYRIVVVDDLPGIIGASCIRYAVGMVIRSLVLLCVFIRRVGPISVLLLLLSNDLVVHQGADRSYPICTNVCIRFSGLGLGSKRLISKISELRSALDLPPYFKCLLSSKWYLHK